MYSILVFYSAVIALSLVGVKSNSVHYNNNNNNDVKNIAHKFNQGDLTNENSVEHNNNNNNNKVEYKVHGGEIIEPSPCQLVRTKYGCCWDDKLIALGPNGKGCPVCKDHRHMKCKNWKKNCHEKIVASMCPATCGKCPAQQNQLKSKQKKCYDDKIWRELCPVYQSLGFCKQKTIARHCRMTCSKCT